MPKPRWFPVEVRIESDTETGLSLEALKNKRFKLRVCCVEQREDGTVIAHGLVKERKKQ